MAEISNFSAGGARDAIPAMILSMSMWYPQSALYKAIAVVIFWRHWWPNDVVLAVVGEEEVPVDS